MVLLTQARYCSALHTCIPQLQTFSALPGMSPYTLGNKEHVNFGFNLPWSSPPLAIRPRGSLLQCPHSQGTENIPVGLSVILGSVSDSGAVQSLRLFAELSVCHTYICKHTHLYRHTCISVICVWIYTCDITLSHHSCSALESFLTL